MDKLTIGIIGLSTMGKSLALNMADHQIKVAGYNGVLTALNTLKCVRLQKNKSK